MIEFFLLISVVGLLGMTWLFPFLAGVGAQVRSIRKSRSITPPDVMDSTHPLKIVIALPAFNEEKSLPQTLSSILKAVSRARGKFSGVNFEVVVGDDGSTDGTSEVARRKKVQVVRLEKSSGKWNMLRLLLDSYRDADWVIFADAGVVWREDLLIRSYPFLRRADVLAIAPTYFNPDGGRVERALWRLERHFKRIESFAGGPVSIHGATIFYRRRPLMKTLRFLRRRAWFNDDVVVPLSMRALYPNGRVEYLADLGVYDRPQNREKPQRSEFARRKRMVAGNVQWITQLGAVVLGRNFTAGLLALRRVFRLFWAYWALASAILTGFLLVQLGAEIVFVISVLAGTFLFFVYRYSPARLISESAIASLMAPYYFLPSSKKEGVRWK